MARMLVAALLAAAAATPLLAVPPLPVAPPAPMAPMAPMAPRGMMPTARAEVQAHVAQLFAQRDTNRDGFLAAEELQVRRGMGGGRSERANVIVRRMGPDGAPRAMGNADAAFDRLDSNRDGKITRDEFGKARQIRIEKRVMVDGQRGPDGAMGAPGVPGQRREVRIVRHGGGMMGAALLQRADANHDGRVSLAEATGAALQHFDMMDANRDGRITPEERAAGRAHMMQMRKAG